MPNHNKLYEYDFLESIPRELFQQAGVAAMAGDAEQLAEQLQSESFAFSDCTCRLKEDLFETIIM